VLEKAPLSVTGEATVPTPAAEEGVGAGNEVYLLLLFPFPPLSVVV
jgi:hypothetical protein